MASRSVEMAVLQREGNKTVIRMLTQKEIGTLISDFEKADAAEQAEKAASS